MESVGHSRFLLTSFSAAYTQQMAKGRQCTPKNMPFRERSEEDRKHEGKHRRLTGQSEDHLQASILNQLPTRSVQQAPFAKNVRNRQTMLPNLHNQQHSEVLLFGFAWNSGCNIITLVFWTFAHWIPDVLVRRCLFELDSTESTYNLANSSREFEMLWLVTPTSSGENVRQGVPVKSSSPSCVAIRGYHFCCLYVAVILETVFLRYGTKG